MTELIHRTPEARIASDGVERQRFRTSASLASWLMFIFWDVSLPPLTGCSRCSAPGWRRCCCCYAIPVDGPGKWLAGLRRRPSAARCSFGRSVRNAVVLVMMFVPIALVEYIALRVAKKNSGLETCWPRR